MYCGAVIKNSGTNTATGVKLRLEIMNNDSTTVIEVYTSDPYNLAPAEELTIELPDSIVNTSWYWNRMMKFTAIFDSADSNPSDNYRFVPYPDLYDHMWSHASRSFRNNNNYELGATGNLGEGDEFGFTVSTSDWHQMAYVELYIDDTIPTSVVLNLNIYENGNLIATGLFGPQYEGYPWIMALIEPWGLFYPDSIYYITAVITNLSGTTVKIGTDTANYHNFGIETISKHNGIWGTLDFVPVMRMVCDPEGVPEHGYLPEVRIYPVPATDLLTSSSKENHNICLSDMSGRIVFNDNTSSDQHQMDVSGFPDGMYIARISFENGAKVFRKVIIK
jgi:hypothetical protein